MALVRRSVIVSGRVQGVGFRWSVDRRAREHGVSGWVRNRADGTVEAELEGSPDAVEAMTEWLRVGPPGAIVDRVEFAVIATLGDQAFHIR